MATLDLNTLTIQKAHDMLVAGQTTAVALAQAYLDVIAADNAQINAYLEVYDDVLEQARRADVYIAERISSGAPVPLLAGIPIAVKDNILIEGKIASAASHILEKYRATYDATVIAKLKEQHTVFLGRTNMDEFAMGGSTENSAFGVSRNPHDTDRVAGGSSGGSAAALAMNGALAALGTDTGGSVRQPASFCGHVALKPTYGALSRYGIMAMGSSLDQVGPMTKTVTDAEILFNTLKGQDPMDSTTISDATYPKRALRGGNGSGSGSAKPVIGVPSEFLNMSQAEGSVAAGIDPAVRKNFEETLERFKKLGYEIRGVELPNLKYSLAVYYIVMPAEVSSNLARFDGMKYGLHKDGKDLIDDYFVTRGEGFGREVRRRIILGTYVLSSGYYDAYYNKATALRGVITQDFIKAFEGVDIILTPTTPAPAFKIGEKASNPLEMYLADIFTVTANLTGLPALAIPSGTTPVDGKNLPLGIQMTAAHGAEDVLFAAGKEFLGE